MIERRCVLKKKKCEPAPKAGAKQALTSMIEQVEVAAED